MVTIPKKLYRVSLVCYVVFVVIVGLARGFMDVSVSPAILIGVTIIIAVLSAFFIRDRVTSGPSWPPVAAALVSSLLTLVVLYVLGVPPRYSRAVAVLAFGLAAYPFVRRINEETLPFPMYAGLWLIAATGILLWSYTP